MALRNQHRTSTEANQFVDGLLVMAQRQLAKEQAGLAKEQAELAKEQAELAEEKEKLKQADARLQQSGARLQQSGARLQQSEARLQKAEARSQQADVRLQQSGEKLAKEQEISANKKKFKIFSEEEVLPFKQANEFLKQYTDRLKPRMELAIAIAAGIQEYEALKEEALKKTKLAALQETINTIEKSIHEENALQKQSLDQIAPWKAILAQMKEWIDVLPEEDRDSYETQIKRYESSMRRFKNFEEKYQKMLPGRGKVDKACQEMKGKVDLLTEAFQNELREHSIGTPPSPVSSMKASGTPLRSGSDSDRMAVASDTPSSGRSSGDVSPERSPDKKGAHAEEKEMPVASLSSVAEPFASQSPAAAAPAPARKGLLSKLFSSKKPTPPVLPAKPAVTNGQKQEHQAPGFK